MAFQFIYLSLNYFGLLKIKLFSLISDPKEENEESEVEEKHHVKPEEKLLNHSKTKNRFLKERRAEKSSTCFQCGESFTCEQSLEIHMRVHTKEKPHSCSLCGKSFSLLQSLKLHQKTHTGVREYMCLECGKTFTWAKH